MRTYPRNSPEAAARLVTLVLLADGHICPLESKELMSSDLGLEAEQLSQVVQGVCEDLLLDGYAARTLTATMDDSHMACLMAEVDDPALRCKVLRIASAAAAADGHVRDAEWLVLDAACRHWYLDRHEIDFGDPADAGTHLAGGTHLRSAARI
jgi:hypothetical protein